MAGSYFSNVIGTINLKHRDTLNVNKYLYFYTRYVSVGFMTWKIKSDENRNNFILDITNGDPADFKIKWIDLMQKFKHKVKNFITVYTVLQAIEIKLRQPFFCIIIHNIIILPLPVTVQYRHMASRKKLKQTRVQLQKRHSNIDTYIQIHNFIFLSFSPIHKRAVTSVIQLTTYV